MPSMSGKQHRAMEAAAHGQSTSGIPRSVGQDFTQADKAMKAEKPGKKFNTSAMVKALRKKRAPEDAEAEAMRKGGYSTGNGGVGSG